jgi:hypothetical protein
MAFKPSDLRVQRDHEKSFAGQISRIMGVRHGKTTNQTNI